jgi:hypothetical protein
LAPPVEVGFESELDPVVPVELVFEEVVFKELVVLESDLDEDLVPRVVGSEREVAVAVNSRLMLVRSSVCFPDADMATVVARSDADPHPYWW